MLRTSRLVLRGLHADDLERFATMSAHPEVMCFLGGRPRSRIEAWDDMAESLGQWGLRGYGRFAIADDANRLIGHAGLLHPHDWPAVELSYALDRPYWGLGFAGEAAAAIRDWAFAAFPFAHLASFIAPANHRSRHLAERLGAVREGTIELRGQQPENWIHYRPGTGPIA